MEAHPYKQAQNKEPPLSSREWLLFRLSVRLGVKLQAVQYLLHIACTNDNRLFLCSIINTEK